MRRAAVLLAVIGLFVGAGPAGAQSTTTNEFDYSPEAQERGKAISITGRCENDGQLAVSVQQGETGDGSYVFSQSFPAAAGVKVTGSIAVPDDAPFGAYVITGACRVGPNTVFTKNGPFAVVQDASATTTTRPPATTTTTAAPGATTTTAPGATTTTTDATDLPASVEDTDTTDPVDTTTTTLDEFAGTRNDDDDSIGPLLLLVGIVPLGLAAGAIGLAMRRNRSAAAG